MTLIGISLSLGASRHSGDPVPTIQLSATSIAEDAASGSIVGALSVSNGSGSYTYSITADPDSKFAIDGSNLETDATLDYETDTSHSVTIEADNGVDDPISRVFTITVTNVLEVTLNALTLSADEWTIGTPSSGTIDGDTAGSSISVSGALPTGLTIDTTARTWDWDGTGSVSTGSFDLVETHVDASNSPRTSTISWGIVDVPDDFDAHIVMLGDSIGDQAFNGWSAIENLGYASTTVSNLSLGGKTLSTWLTDVQAGDIDAEYDPDRPCFAIIQAGTNDIFSGGGLTGAALSVVAASLIALVKEKGFYAVLVPLIARENANSTWQGYRTDYNNWCLGGETGADLVVDMTDDPIVGDDADFDLTYWEDEDPVLHPNQPGQENIRDIYKYPENLPSILGSEPREPAPPPSGGDIDPLTGSGVSYATGTFGQARSTGGLTVPTTVFPVPVATERTVTMWCKRDTAPSSLEVIIGVDDNDYLAWDGTGLTGTFGSTSISTATWHHIAIEWGAVYFRVYLDGTRVFQTTVMPNGNRQLEIGQYYGSYNFGGLIDQIEVWDSALYNDVGFTPPSAPVTGGTAGLIGAYRLDGDLVGYQA